MQSRWLHTLAGVMLAFVVNGSAEAQTYSVVGPGVSSCGTWTADQSNATAYQIDLSWVLGFLAGIAYASLDNPLHGLDANAVADWIDNYCQAHPLEHIIDAADALARAHPR
jgi:hypothetical protein